MLKIKNLQSSKFDKKEFSKKGLRILVCAYKEITDLEYKNWNDRFQTAKLHFDSQFQIDNLIDEMESDLELIGSTAVDDKLQDEVSSTLDCFKKAGIGIWILTGDKLQTALNIAKSCGLLTLKMLCRPNLVVLELKEDVSDEDGRSIIKSKIELAKEEICQKRGDFEDQALVITGRVLNIVFPKKKKMARFDDLQKLVFKIKRFFCCREKDG
ncbi:hypothetical protein MHBO_002751 [Bonamia ostreae]|uniref:Phospholipid-transporting ATPase n=1 Tax=Bonamia ostreae TaxID=126728 RepID=A0ABV2ANG9_9EUKA